MGFDILEDLEHAERLLEENGEECNTLFADAKDNLQDLQLNVDSAFDNHEDTDDRLVDVECAHDCLTILLEELDKLKKLLIERQPIEEDIRELRHSIPEDYPDEDPYKDARWDYRTAQGY